MSGCYWLVELSDPKGPGYGCVFDFSPEGAMDAARKQYGPSLVTKAPEPLGFRWFHYEPVKVPPGKAGTGDAAAYSLRDQFFAGGSIGCEVDGLEIMFVPELLPEPVDDGEGEEATTVYGDAVVRVNGHESLGRRIRIEGLDDAHLIDRLSGEAAHVAGTARKAAARSAAYDRLAAAARKLAGGLSLRASLPGESAEAARERLSVLPPRVAAMFAALDRMAPLERAPGDGIWETLILETAGGGAWIGVVNAAGEKDRVTTFGTAPKLGFLFDLWCRCREESLPGRSPWDEARAERRVVMYAHEPTVIDRGANYVTDLLTAAGCAVHYTCEGHPHSAYAGFSGESQGRMAEEFRKAGWTVEESPDRVTVRMPEVGNVAERDAAWRKLSHELSPVPARGTSSKP